VFDMICVYKVHPDALVPRYATKDAACFDIHACLAPDMVVDRMGANNVPQTLTIKDDRSLVLGPGQRVLIPTGLIFDIPHKHSLRLHPRSGIAYKHGIGLSNCEGVVDEDYTKPVFVALINNSKVSFTVNHGDRICQAEVVYDTRMDIIETPIKPIKVTHRSGGFGSTGI